MIVNVEPDNADGGDFEEPSETELPESDELDGLESGDTGPDENLGPSKSQRKREAHAAQDLGKQLVALAASELDSVPLEDRLLDAIVEARNIKSNGARKRQLNYIGKLMRATDLEPIRQALDHINQSANRENRLLHELEQWREDLLADEAAALQRFLSLYPDTETQPLRQLLRNTRREQQHNKPPKSYRELFKALRTIVQTHQTRDQGFGEQS